MGNGFIVSKESWDRMEEEERKWITFDTLQAVNARLKALEKWNSCFSFIGGICGGVMSWLGLKLGL